ncbi:MAG: hypothetical protein E7005_07230 [Alphaproteobacteria bacterium]|nr:hypothetical protein [Alphaproteobacteria bacterium]
MSNKLYWLEDITNNSDIIEFFVKFSRFEYALKKNGYYIFNKKTNIIIKTNFDKFASKYKKNKLSDKLQDFLIYLDNNPVGKLKSDGTYDKSKESASSEIQRLMRYITIIRNNLFHGVKYSNLLGVDEHQRNKKLITNGILAIDFFVELDDNVYSTYKE